VIDEQSEFDPMPEDKKGFRHALDPFSIATATLGQALGRHLS
jgi:hypothetical protein